MSTVGFSGTLNLMAWFSLRFYDFYLGVFSFFENKANFRRLITFDELD